MAGNEGITAGYKYLVSVISTHLQDCQKVPPFILLFYMILLWWKIPKEETKVVGKGKAVFNNLQVSGGGLCLNESAAVFFFLQQAQTARRWANNPQLAYVLIML